MFPSQNRRFLSEYRIFLVKIDVSKYMLILMLSSLNVFESKQFCFQVKGFSKLCFQVKGFSKLCFQVHFYQQTLLSTSGIHQSE